jgi:hypothetical protein
MHNFLIILLQIEQFKLSCNSKGNKVIFKDFLRGSEIGYKLFDWEIFVQMIAPYFGGS